MNRKIQYVLSHPDGHLASVECTCSQNEPAENILAQWAPERILGVLKREVDKLVAAGYCLSNWHVIEPDRNDTDNVAVHVYGWQPVRLITFQGADLTDPFTLPAPLTFEELKQHQHDPDDGSWWENDAQGIPLCRVCDECRTAKLSRYRPEILSGYTQADVCEPIEPD